MRARRKRVLVGAEAWHHERRTVEPDVVFDLALEHGRCVGLRMPSEAGALEDLAQRVLLAEERAHTSNAAPVRRRAWVGGRAALRLAFARAGVDAPAVLADERGAPRVPSGVAASISHSDWVAVALVAREPRARVGVDVEVDRTPNIDIAPRVLAGDELWEIAGLGANEHAREVLLRFSAKEAIYKALDPFVRRYVGFKEVSVSPRPTGKARVIFRSRGGEGPFAIDAFWRRFEGVVLTTARVEPALESAGFTRPAGVAH